MKTTSPLHLLARGASERSRRNADRPAHAARAGMLAWLLCGLLAVATNQALALTQVISITPLPNAVHQLPSANIVVRFDSAIDTNTVTTNSFLVWGELSGSYTGIFSFASGNTEITFIPGAPFASGETVRINVSSQIHNALGAAISPWASQFTVRSAASAAEFARGVVTYGTGTSQQSLFTFDLNRDGKLDLVVGSGTSGNTVTVLLGNGDGTFAPKVQYPTGGAAIGVGVADVDGDGYGDILAANYAAAGSVGVLLNDGTGHFGPPTTYAVAGLAPLTVAAEDLDGDGYVDMVVSVFPGFQVFFNDGTGHFPTSVQINGHDRGSGLALGDMNGDGLLDIVCSDQVNRYCSVTTNGGNRTFGMPVKYAVGNETRGVAVADFNRDGALDIVVANRNSGSITILTNKDDGTGTFPGRADYLVNGTPWGVTVADFDGDGWPDVASANAESGYIYANRSVSFWHNSGGGALDIRKDVNANDTYAFDLVAGDFDGDGDLDLVAANSGSVSFLENTEASITGFVYLDEDRNCAQNGLNEIGVSGRLVRLTDNASVPRYEITRRDGTFKSVAAAGSYTVNMVPTPTIMETCNFGQGVTYNVTVTEGVPITNLNFAVKHCCQASVTCVSRVNWPCPPNPPVPCTQHTNHLRSLCPCEKFQYQVTVCNTCTSPLLPGSVIQLQLDPNVMFCSFPAFISTCNNVIGSVPGLGMADTNSSPCDPNGSANTGQLVQWVLNSALNPSDCCTFFVDVQVANVPLGTVLCSLPTLTAHCNPGNVQITVPGPPCYDTVLCSFDPNDKTVSPAGCGPFGNVLPGTPLTYRVRFQNLGNAPARRVLIRDWLDPMLDANTLEFLSISHPVTEFRILPGQEMIWIFDGINLPDATSDELGSRGEIVYRVRPKSSAGEGTPILNSAAIYFDLNLPVITVTTTNTIRSVPEPNAGFSSALVSTNPATYNFTYTGGTADGASFAWDFGADVSPATSTNQNVSGVSYSTEGPKLITLVVTRYGCLTANQTVVWVGPCEGLPTLSVSRSTNQVIVSWTDCGILQVAESITGPWQDVLARKPYTNDISARQRFYRTRK